MKDVLIFVHIPKTAGTTFAAILDRNFKSSRIVNIYSNFGISEDEFRDLPETTRGVIECVKGHFDYGIHRTLGRPFRYVTLLRHPVEQVHSRYNHMRSSRSHPLHRMAQQGISLEEFVRLSPDNYQTRTLAGIELTPGHEHPPLTERHLEQVKRHIEENFSLVGIVERFDESLVLAKRILGLEQILYVSRNVRRRPEHSRSLSESTRRVIEEHARLDFALYAWALARLERAMREDRETFNNDLSAFRKANARYSRVMSPVDALSYRATKAARHLRFRFRKLTRVR